jgi:DivIVA domain-containing protein
VNASDIAAQEFPVVRKGYDPAEVRAFLTEICASGLVGDLDLEQVHATAQAEAARIVAEAQHSADDLVEQAIAEADRLREAASAALAEARTVLWEGIAAAKARSDQAVEHATALISAADAHAEERVRAAEEHARECATAVLDSAKRRLQRLLDAEAEVHHRLHAALGSVSAPSGQIIEREDEVLLDLAFAEFFESDFEHDESRAWILSDQPG